MATDEGVRASYIEALDRAIEQRRGEREKVRERLRVARLENDAQALLTPEDAAILAQAKIVDAEDVTTLIAERDRLTNEIEAIRRLIAAAQQVE